MKIINLCLLFISLIYIANIKASIVDYNLNREEFNAYKKESAFLERLGFYPFTSEIKESLKSENLNKVSEAVLKSNQTRYEIIDSAKDLDAFIFSKIDKTIFNDRNKVNKLHALIIHNLAFKKSFIQNISNKISSDILKNLDDIESDLSTHLKKEQDLEIELISSILGDKISNDEQIALAKNWANYINLENNDYDLSHSHFLGRAIVLSFVKLIRESKLNNEEKALNEKLLKHKIYLDNYISDSQTYLDVNNKLIKIKLHKGDFANEYSSGAEAYYISIGTLPKGLKNKFAAIKNHVYGNIFLSVIYPTPNREDEIQKKTESNIPLNTIEQIQNYLLKKKKKISGFSHVGLVDVLTDKETNISSSWVWDSYPNDTLGGIRFVGVDGFSFAEDFQKVGFTHYDPTKFLNYAKKQIQTRGYLKNVWESTLSDIDDDGNLVAVDDSTYSWPTHIEESEVKNILNISSADSEKWFENFIAPKVTNEFHHYLSSPEALAFANGFLNTKNAAYCSQAVLLAFLQGTDIDPEVVQDKYSFVVRIGKKMGLPDLKDVNFDKRIVSPAGFSWQLDLVQSTDSVVLPKSVDLKDSDLNFLILKAQE